MKDTVRYKVCIRCITYNHSKYIVDTMNGFAIQQTIFPFICCIIDDCSPDGEQYVIKDYIQKNCIIEQDGVSETDEATIIRAVHKSNSNCHYAVTMLKYNFYSIGKRKSEYINRYREGCEYDALCEGDDYWNDPLKLQKQIDILDNDSEIGLIYTMADRYEEKCGKINGTWGTMCDYKDLLFGASPIPTLSTCFRSSLYDEYLVSIKGNPSWPLGDVPLWLYFFRYSKVYFLEEVTGVYRELLESASHSQDPKKRISFFDGAYRCRAFFAEKYWGRPLARAVHKKRLYQIANDCISTGYRYQTFFSELREWNIYSPIIWVKCLIVSSPVFCKNYIKFRNLFK